MQEEHQRLPHEAAMGQADPSARTGARGGRADFLMRLGFLHTTVQASVSRWSAKAHGNNIDRLDCNIPSGQNKGLKAERHRLSPADAGSGGPPRPGVDPVTLARNTARNPRKKECGNFFAPN